MGRKSFEKAGGLSPERIRQMDADIAQALSSERETGGVDVPSLKLLDAIDAKIRRRNRRSVAGAFAAVCLPLVALCLTAFAELYGWGHEPVMRSVQVPAGEHLRVLLADGSAVTLNACSELRYPERFARRRREVRLVRGEAFFEVAHDATAPFTVETDDVSVEVLGTKFNVNAYDKEVTTVYLKEGKVRLTERVTGRQNRYLMAPDEMLAVDRNARTCRAVRPAGKSAPEAWLHNNYAFTNAPLEDVVEFLERHYAVEIEVTDTRILQYSYTMEFYNETIDEVLSVMSQITPIRYSRVNDRITVRAAR